LEKQIEIFKKSILLHKMTQHKFTAQVKVFFSPTDCIFYVIGMQELSAATFNSVENPTTVSFGLEMIDPTWVNVMDPIFRRFS
jgi:hypothetical protein